MNNSHILRITHFFSLTNFNEIFKDKNVNDKIQYTEMIKKLTDENIDISESLSRELKNLGNKVDVVYFNAEDLQKIWAKERSIKYSESFWKEEILLAQIAYYKPDILFFQKGTSFKSDYLQSLKKRFPFIKKIVFHTAYLGTTWRMDVVDHLLVGTPGLVERYRQKGLKAELFYHYFDKEIWERYSSFPKEKKYDVTFLGASGYGGGFLHSARYQYLEYLIKNTNIVMWLLESNKKIKNDRYKIMFRNTLKKALAFIPDSTLNFLQKLIKKEKFNNTILEVLLEKQFGKEGKVVPKDPLTRIYPERCFNALHGKDYYEKIAMSKISFCKSGEVIFHGKSTKGNIGALRLFESTGLGSCLVTDWGPNLNDLFEDGKEIISYKNKEEAASNILYLLNNKRVRDEIAAAGQARTFKDHLAVNRAEQFQYIISQK
jgi:spore maturation protein CgeB